MTRHKNRNRYESKGGFIIGYTFKNQEFYIDESDLDLVSKYNWSISTTDGYLYTSIYIFKSTMTMHKLLMSTPIGLYVDHINRNRIDNRRENLRIVTKQENRINSGIQSNNTSGIIGVKQYTKYIGDKKWRVQINGGLNNRIHLGVFDNFEDAVICRLKAELKYYGRDFSPQRHLFEKYGI